MTDSNNGAHAARRAAIRREVVPVEIKGLLDADGGVHVPFLIWDLSDTGLGIWVPSPIDRGIKVRMNVAVPRKCRLDGIVQWCEKSKDNFEGWRIGINIESGHDHVKALMEDIRKAKEKKSAGPISRA